MSDPIADAARKIIMDAIDHIDYQTICEQSGDLDPEEVEKRIEGAVVHITIPTASGCTCLGLSHQRECPDWRMPL